MPLQKVTHHLLRLAQNGLGAPVLLILILLMVVIPLPPLALDMLFSFNIALSLVILLVVVYSHRPLDFTVFPTVLLITTLLRLALNIASTRVVLLHGHSGADAAGQVIEAFGNFVVGGNYAVGLVVFAILVIINFVVVTKGAGRISEVSARFTLDALPGKQMAIDADLNAGLVDQDEAKLRRAEVIREADFYGSMDGASKFVRGDAVAGILILVINIVGGLFIGTLQHGLDFDIALENYTLLTIGDGLVAQLPSLLLSTAAAIMVTRASGDQDMGQQVVSQLFNSPQSLAVSAGILGLLGVIPGMPNLPFLSLAIIASYLAWHVARRENKSPEPELISEPTTPPSQHEVDWNDVPALDPINLEVGYRLISLVDRNQNGQLLTRIRGVRKKLSKELGFLVAPVHIRDNLDLTPNQYRIALFGVTVADGEAFPERELAINPGQVHGDLQGIKTEDPAFKLAAVWVEPSEREHAQTLGYTVVDASTVIATHLNQVLLQHAQELLGHEETQELLERLRKSAPRLVEDLVPKTLPLRVIVKVLQNLLAEGIPVRDIRTTAETLADHAAKSQDPDILTAAVRIALGRMIIQNINGLSEEIQVFTLDAKLEQLLQKVVQMNEHEQAPVEPGLAERLYNSLRDLVQQQDASGQPAVLLVSDTLRTMLARFLKPRVPSLHVLAYSEIRDANKLKVIATVG